jgi:transposase
VNNFLEFCSGVDGIWKSLKPQATDTPYKRKDAQALGSGPAATAQPARRSTQEDFRRRKLYMNNAAAEPFTIKPQQRKDMNRVLQLSFDWASQEHSYAWLDTVSGATGSGVVQANPERFRHWFDQLRARFCGYQIEVIVEMSKGPLIWMLNDYEQVTIFVLNPICSANYRKACNPSGAKDDASDAALWLAYLDKHRDQLRPLRLGEPKYRQLDRLCRDRRDFVHTQTRLLQKTQAVLGEYFPQALEIAGKENTKLFRAFLKRWPDLPTLQRARKQTLEKFFVKNRVRNRASIERRLAVLEQAVVLTPDESIVKTARIRLLGLIAQLEVVADTIAQYDQAIEEFMRQNIPTWQCELVKSLPSAGDRFAPRLIVAIEAMAELRDPDRASAFAGIAPVTKRSGKKTLIHRRLSRPKFLHQTFVEYAHLSLRSSLWAQQYYDQRKQRGDHHWSILRSLAFKWMRIFLKCWETRQPYDENYHIQNLSSRLSPYAPKAA